MRSPAAVAALLAVLAPAAGAFQAPSDLSVILRRVVVDDRNCPSVEEEAETVSAQYLPYCEITFRDGSARIPFVRSDGARVPRFVELRVKRRTPYGSAGLQAESNVMVVVTAKGEVVAVIRRVPEPCPRKGCADKERADVWNADGSYYGSVASTHRDETDVDVQAELTGPDGAVARLRARAF